MSNFVIRDLAFISELDTQASSVDGGASAGAAASADYNNAAAASGSTTDGNVRARADGGYSSYYSYGSPSASVDTEDRYRYPYYY